MPHASTIAGEAKEQCLLSLGEARMTCIANAFVGEPTSCKCRTRTTVALARVQRAAGES